VVFIFIEKPDIFNGNGKQFLSWFVLFSGNYPGLDGLSNLDVSVQVTAWTPHCRRLQQGFGSRVKILCRSAEIEEFYCA